MHLPARKSGTAGQVVERPPETASERRPVHAGYPGDVTLADYYKRVMQRADVASPSRRCQYCGWDLSKPTPMRWIPTP